MDEATVRALQVLLRGLGTYAGAIDGNAGPVTQKAIELASTALDAAEKAGRIRRDLEALEDLVGIFRPQRRPAAIGAQRPVEAPWMRVARGYIGEREFPGAPDNPRIVALYAMCGHKWVNDDETPWCAAFVGGVLAQAGIIGTRSLAARSYATYGTRLPVPLHGCIGVKKRVGGQEWEGHLGFVVGANQSTIFLLGGNQSNMVNVAAFPRSEFIAFRWPPGAVPQKPFPLPTSLKGAAGSATEA